MDAVSPYLVAGAIGLVGVAFVALVSGANRLLAPRGGVVDAVPALEVEPGPASERWAQAYLPQFGAALVYAVVVPGVAYLFPWAAIFAVPGFGAAVVAMVVFAAFPVAGVVYAINGGVGRWR